MWQRYKDMFTGTCNRIAMVKLAIISFVVIFITMYLDSLMGFEYGIGPLYITSIVIISMITISFQIRRLRDGGLNWKHIFWAFCPIIGPFIAMYQIYFRASRPQV